MTDPKEVEKRSPSKLLVLIFALLILVAFIMGVVVSAVTAPEPNVMAPGPSYFHEEPLEHI